MKVAIWVLTQRGNGQGERMLDSAAGCVLYLSHELNHSCTSVRHPSKLACILIQLLVGHFDARC